MKNQIKKTGILLMLVAILAIGMFPVQNANAQALEEGSMLLRTTEFTIKPGHDTQFQEGIKAWKKCYLDNEGDWNWAMWSRVNGTGNVYLLASFMGSWAEMDDPSDEARQACQNLSQNLINPNIESFTYGLARYLPSLSKSENVPHDVVIVTNWRVKNRLVFRQTVTEISDAMYEAVGERRGYWYETYGGDTHS